MTTLKELRFRTHKNLQTLKERRAKQGTDPDLKLLNEIEDHEQALALIDEVFTVELTGQRVAALQKALRPLLIASNVDHIDLATLEPEKPRLLFEPETVLIPAGVFVMGSTEGQAYEGPPHEVHLPAYRMGKYPLTNEQFAAFIEATGKVVPSLGWPSQRPSDAQKKLPVRGVTWYLAVDYCDWLSEQTGRTYALPTEPEWEKAARGLNGRRFPWGDAWQEGRCNADPTQITPVDRYEAQSVFGCYDLVGNLREWTCSLWGSRPRRPEPQFAYPQTREQSDQTWRPDSPRHNLAANRQVRRIYRGGPGPTIAQLRCSLRRANMPDTKLDLNRHGLRVVQRTG